MKFSIFWDVTLCTMIRINRRFGRTQPWTLRTASFYYFLEYLVFDPDNRSCMIPRNVRCLSQDYKALYVSRSACRDILTFRNFQHCGEHGHIRAFFFKLLRRLNYPYWWLLDQVVAVSMLKRLLQTYLIEFVFTLPSVLNHITISCRMRLLP